MPMAIREIGDNATFDASAARTPMRQRPSRPAGSPARPDVVTVTDSKTLADRLEDLLPQTQCTKCGYDGCRPYAEAVAAGAANYNQCPPGGAEGVARLARVLGKPVIPINPVNGVERARPVAFIDEQLCIGCTLCMQACPVDAIVGAPKQMHTIVKDLCTGCDLCVAPCPVDCIAMIPVTGDATGWDAWTQQQADAARLRHDRRAARLARERDAAEARAAARRHAAASPPQAAAKDETASAAAATTSAATPATAAADDPEAKKRAIIQAALERARQKKAELAVRGEGPRNTENVSADVQAQIDAAEARRRRIGIDDGQPDEARGEPSSDAPPRNDDNNNDPSS
ncbi:electron transport complex protein RnfB [Paraburkholderia caballeronis]|uniref:Electron transport complex protein RnfB n=1 Tax=Paraburkholderia caballeronis TaxID=416943 RepID=A0A1H7T5E4_9BURK|nr:electron transport complex protein RnfB [Paraburkholderia caballeronis]PXW96821.1 electron transport complex protein RnfB [Paraburkholderia caballeronis]RAJ93448.1 electron transport complex protein RnfB [Paraburkholderia caballeronis]SEC72416.1 electron transport complex protein RnfB [Paraburkholderia caballeronis]SEL80023.1 electron transport complex protein RnfB [Paraburkholderia caballeronis]